MKNSSLVGARPPPKTTRISNDFDVTQVLPASEGGDDTVTCLRFDPSGQRLAVGTKSGHVLVFEERSNHQYSLESSVQAYRLQIDLLNSVDIDPKVKDMCWLKTGSTSGLLLTANEKQIQLYKISTKQGKLVSGKNLNNFLGLGLNSMTLKQLEVPRLVKTEPTMECKAKRVYCAEHEYQINAISVASDGEYFLTSDDLVIHLWHIGHIDNSLKLVNMKPECMEDLNETITTSSFHPTHSHLFCFSTSKGVTQLCDLRMAVLCSNYAAQFDASGFRSPAHIDPFYASVLNGVSHLSFNPINGRQFATRDYLTIKIWDMANSSQPVKVLPVQDHLLPTSLVDLYESDTILDKFEVSWSYDGTQVATGMYRNQWAVFHVDTETRYMQSPCRSNARWTPAQLSEVYSESDFANKSLSIQSHPKRRLFALGSGSCSGLFTSL